MENFGVRYAFTYFFFAWLLLSTQKAPDFGPDGMAGLNPKEKQRLFKGEIIFPRSIAQTAGGKSLIEAVLLLHRPTEEVWQLLARTEDQVRYLDHIKKIAVLYKTPTEDKLEFTTKIAMKTFVYRVVHRFDEKNFSIWWTLDRSFQNDLEELEGFWRFYPLNQEKTIARYGSRVCPDFPVPKFIFNALTKSDLRSALASVKKYVDSGGVWRKDSPWPE